MVPAHVINKISVALLISAYKCLCLLCTKTFATLICGHKCFCSGIPPPIPSLPLILSSLPSLLLTPPSSSPLPPHLPSSSSLPPPHPSLLTLPSSPPLPPPHPPPIPPPHPSSSLVGAAPSSPFTLTPLRTLPIGRGSSSPDDVQDPSAVVSKPGSLARCVKHVL